MASSPYCCSCHAAMMQSRQNWQGNDGCGYSKFKIGASHVKIPCSGHSAMKRGNDAAWRPATSGQASVTTNADAPAVFGTLRLLVAEMLPIFIGNGAPFIL